MAAAIAESTCCGHFLSSTRYERGPKAECRTLNIATHMPIFSCGTKRALRGANGRKQKSHFLSGVPLSRPSAGQTRSAGVQCSAAGASSGGFAEGEDPYKILGVTPLASSDEVMVARRRRVKEAERRGDYSAQEKYEKAYDSIMYGQLNKRAAGIAFGNVEVSKDIKYADRQPITPKWWPKKAPVDRKNMLINAAVAFLLILSTASMKTPNVDKLPMVLIAMILRLYFKLGEFYPYEDQDTEAKNKARNQLLLRVLGLSFGSFGVAGLISSIAASSLAFPPAIVVNTVVVATVFYVVSFLR